MERRELLKLAEYMLRLPTAPYHEHAVREFVIQYCRQLGLHVGEDRAGNVVVKHERPQAGRSRHRETAQPPLVFVAHMDHPGFEMLRGHRAEFLGGVPREMFARGVGVRMFGRDGICPMEIRRFIGSAWPKRKLVDLKAAGGGARATRKLRKGDFGMWNLPAFRVVGDRLHAAAIDDVLGSVVMLATLTEVLRRRLRTHVWCAFTRAEEVGFQGALALVRANKIPKTAVVISIEMSKQRPWARIGDGPVVRVGDRSSIFNPGTTAFLLRAAARCRERQPQFLVQRCLMDGGSCEATAFAGCGYRTGGLCLPLGNYHNIGKRRRPQAEYVSIRDLEQLLNLAVTACAEWRTLPATNAILKKRLLALAKSVPRPL
ncbi:MAG TPA: M28 family peptidase [Verrucomicrobiae bacterium]|nr:M28 family peptidase [Verrucomicrobiae bacterium]